MRQTRLAYPVGVLSPGGAELQMIALTRYLTQHGFDVDVVLRAGPGPLDDEARAAGARIRQTGELSDSDTPRHIAYARRVGRYASWISVARGHYDIVDSWLYPADVEVALSRPLTRTPVVMSARLGRSPRNRLGPAGGIVERLVNRQTDMVAANSDVSAADAVAGGMPPERVCVIRGGVRMPRPFTSDERRGQRSALGVGDGQLLIGNVGNFRSMKRQDLLLEALAQLLPERSDLQLVLVGDGALRPQIEQQIERLGIGEHVILMGTVGDVAPIYDAMDLFVQASNSEGLPNVLLEAAAASLPIVATAAGGSGEVVRDGETGLLVPTDDLNALTGAILTAVSDAGLRRRLGNAARELIEQEYGMERFFRQYANLYSRLLADKRALSGEP